MKASMNQIEEYESQLADVKALLQASPEDEGLLSLQKDLLELLALTKASLPEQEENTDAEPEPESTTAVESPVDLEDSAAAAAAVIPTAAAAPPTKKKKLKVKEFEIPEHLKPKPDDTEAETNKKRRAVKKLKNKWREHKKEVESTKKQQSWQSFQDKKKRSNKSSIFATQEEGSKSMTEFGARKRHKHSS
jgi:hypothetical protein